MSLTKELIERGFINQFSAENLESILDGSKRTIYHGIDPSADSAHIGNFVVWMLLKHLSKNGHKIIFLVGGATGMIGDPKPDAERLLKPIEEIEKNVLKIRIQAQNFFHDGEVEFVNNYEWFKDMTLLDFLRDVGKHYTVGELVKKEAISNRLKSDSGLSYTEFAYPLLQGYDYYKLNQLKDCTVQVGGSDQWGNILSGVELVRRKEQKEVYALTVPLIVDKVTGKKFGKSEGNAVWLDKEKTPPYKFYQFWLNVSDESVVDYLKLFTLLELSEIEEIKKELEQNPGKRKAQKQLAYRVTEIVHGLPIAEAVQNVSNIFFDNKSLESLSEKEKEILLTTAPSTNLKNGTSLIDVLVETGLASSKREAKMFVESGAVVIGGEKVESLDYKINSEKSSNNLILIKRGKKHFHLVNIN